MKPGTVKLGSICKLYNGRTFKASEWKTEGLPIIRIQNLKDSEKVFNYWGNGFDGQVKVISGDLLLAWSGTPGTSFGAHIWRGPAGVLNQHIFRVDLDENRVTKEWAMYAINVQLDVLIGGAHGGVGLKHVTKSQVEDLDILLPPLDEQERRCERIGFARRLQDARYRTLIDIDNYLRSTFIEMFGDPVTNPKGWPIKRLDEVASIGSGVTKGKKYSDQSVVATPYLRVANVQAGYLDLREIKTIEVTPVEVERYRLKTGDVLMTEGGDWDKLGRGAVWNGSIDPCIHQNHIFRVRCDGALVIPDYLEALLQTPYAKAYFQKAAKQTTNLATINKTQLSAFPVLSPELKLQQKFAVKCKKIVDLQQNMNQSAEELRTLFQSTLAEVFVHDD